MISGKQAGVDFTRTLFDFGRTRIGMSCRYVLVIHGAGVDGAHTRRSELGTRRRD
jgi:hypothetical protein